MQKVANRLRVRHYPQVPCKPFCVDVSDEFEAAKVMKMLADQHDFLFKNNIIPDYSNAIMVVMWDEDPDAADGYDWMDYYNLAEDMDWEEFAETYIEDK